MSLRRLAVIVTLVFVGCGAPSPSGPPATPTISCVGIPAPKCDEAVASVARSLPHTVPVSIEVSCVSGTCTPESGAMDTVVTLADGSQLRSSTSSWNGGGQGPGLGSPLPVPADVPALLVVPQCIGVPAGMCQSMAQSAAMDVGARVIVQIAIRCGASPCTDKQGEGDTVVTFSDGTTQTIGWGYQNN